MATRTDAKISAVSQEVASVISEIPAYVTSQGDVNETNITGMSQVLRTLEAQGKATDSNSSGKATATIKTQNDSGKLVPCITIEVNSTTMEVNGTTGAGAICDGVRKRIPDQNFTIAGSSVKF